MFVLYKSNLTLKWTSKNGTPSWATTLSKRGGLHTMIIGKVVLMAA
jgi:hypothetical protein